MANKTLTATFELIDKMSARMDAISQKGIGMADKISSSTNNANSSYDKMQNAIGKFSGAISDAETKTSGWTDKVGKMSTSLLEATYSNEELVEMGYKTADSLSEQTAETENLSEKTEILGKKYDETSEKTEGLGKKTDGLGEKYEESSKKSEDFGKKSTQAISDLDSALATAGITVTLKQIYDQMSECVQLFSDFEYSVAKVSTLVDTNQVSMGNMSNEILNVSSDLATSATEIGEATYQAISASVEAKNAVSFAGDATKLSTAGFTASATAVDVITTALNAYNLETAQATQISDYLITTQNLGKTTVDELANSIGKVIPLASAYGVEMDNLSTAYAVLTANGVATAESGTYLKAMLTELNKSGTEVAETLQAETGMSFSQLMDKGYSLGDVMQVLGDSVNGDSVAFGNMWSSIEAGTGALSLYNSGAEKFNSVLDSMQNSAGATDEAFNKLSETTEFSKNKMTVASENMRIKVGEALAPAFEKAYQGLEKFSNGISWIAENCPGAVQLISALAVAGGTLTIAIGGYTIATKLATVATTAFTAVMETNPIFLVVSAITAATVGLIALCSSMSESEEKTEHLTVASQKQKDELADLEQEYQNVSNKYGENSEQALSLQYQIDELSTSFESNKQTISELCTEIDNVCEEYDSMSKQWDTNIENMKLENGELLYLADRYEELATKTITSATAHSELGTIIDKLNEKFPNLGLSYDDVGKKAENMAEKVKNAAIEMANDNSIDTISNNIAEGYSEKKILEAKKEVAKANLDAAKQAVIDNDSKWDKALDDNNLDIANECMEKQNDLKESVNKMQEAYDKASEKVSDCNDKIAENEAILAELTPKTAEQIEGINNLDEGINAMVDNVDSQINDLTTDYNKAYNAALESFEGQFNLWDEADKISATSVSNIQKNLQSQLDYWDTYGNSLDKLSNKTSKIEGLNDMLKELNDGSPESANMLAGMANATDAQLQKIVDTWEKANKQMEGAAGSAATVESDLNEKINNLVNTTEQSIKKMDLSDDAKASAQSTMDAYLEEIQRKKSKIVGEISSLTDSVRKSLSGKTFGNYTFTISADDKTDGYAEGTSNAERGWKWVGEEGPELMYFGGGEVVIPHDQSEAIFKNTISADDNSNTSVSPTSIIQGTNSSEKVIVVKIEGGASFSIGKGTDRNEVAAILSSQLEPALVKMLTDEITEGGDDVYEL